MESVSVLGAQVFSRYFRVLETSVKSYRQDQRPPLNAPGTVGIHPWLDKLMAPGLDPQRDFGLQQAKLPVVD